jgi:hypothetical protein
VPWHKLLNKREQNIFFNYLMDRKDNHRGE